jgi:two-component system, NarL family, nitrate/nitrite response regulator NarL
MRLLIVDDHALFTDAIVHILEGMDMEIVGVARSGAEGLALAAKEEPDVLLVDLGLPDMSGIAVGRQVLEKRPETMILVLTGRNEPRSVDEALGSGFHGYITKDIPMDTFAERVRTALGGEVVVPPSRPPSRPSRLIPRNQAAELMARQLTPRELEVLGLLVKGSDNADIAARLSVSPNTVRTHVQSILTKLQVRSRLHAAAFAVRHRLVDVGGSRRTS